MSLAYCGQCYNTGMFTDYIKRSSGFPSGSGLKLIQDYCSCHRGTTRRKQDAIMDTPNWVNPLSLMTDDQIIDSIKTEDRKEKASLN